MTRVLLLLASLCWVAGCTETIQLGGGQLSGLVSLELRPPAAVATVTDLNAGPVVVKFHAIGRFVDGTRRDVTHLVEWSVDNPTPGTVSDGTYLTSNAAGGHVIVRARALAGEGALQADADMHVVISLDLVDGVFPPPIGSEDLFSPEAAVEVGGERAPTLLYPAPGTLFPQDLSRIVFQHAPSPQTDAYRLRLISDSLYISILTGGTRWQPDGAVWSLIAATHPGAEVGLLVEAASSSQPGTIYSAPQATLHFARGGGGGVIYHWSAGSSSIMRSTLSSESPTRLYPLDPDVTCAGCHSVSRDGKQMVLGYDGENLRTIDLEFQTPLIASPPMPVRPMGWSTFSPDGELIVVADEGTLTLRDAQTGNTVGPSLGRLPIPVALNASHPDWSPDGSFVAMTLTADVTNMSVGSGAIARIPYDASTGTWGTHEILVGGSLTNNNYFPKYSPNGRFIAFVHSTGPSQGAPLAELRMIRADGGAQITLNTASHRLGAVDGVPDLANTMPSWAPDVDGNLAWLAFASSRPYGEIIPVRGTAQVWITGIDLARAEIGIDPSYAAFWLTSQDVRVVNNNPIWAPHVQPTN
jgi:Tol biopolymer transport system component